MISIGQSYRSEGRIDVRSILSATILGVVTAVLVAFLIWLWELSPIPTLVILTPLIQGALIGGALAVLITRLKLRHPRLMATVAFACGLGSVGLIHYAHYLHFLDQAAEQYEAMIAGDADMPPAQKEELLANKVKGGKALANLVMINKTGHTGFLGSMMLRADQGVQIKNTTLSGWGLWLLWGGEAVMVGIVATAMARSSAATPFCEDCGLWCSKALSPVILPGESAPAVAAALRVDDVQSLAQLIDEPADADQLDAHRTRATLHSCSECDQTFASIENMETKLKKGKPETKTTMVAKQVRTSPAIVNLLRGPVVVPGVSPPHEIAEHHVIDAPASLEERDL